MTQWPEAVFILKIINRNNIMESMKKHLFILVLIMIVFSSCSTTEKFQVAGTPSTEIYTPSYQKVGTIGADGKANIELTSDAYYAYLLSKAPGTEIYIPFALDYDKKNRVGLQFLEGAGATIAFPGTILALTGAVFALTGDTDTGGPLAGIGGAATVVGCVMGMPANSKLSQKAYKHKFKYVETQQINDDINFSSTVFSDIEKDDEPEEIKNKTEVEPVKEEYSSVSRRIVGEKSTKTLKDYGKTLAGIYTGEGSLTQGEEDIETYKDIKIEMVRVNKNEVDVNVIDSDGSKFFESASRYIIEKKADNSFLLTHSTIKSAQITITKNNSLTYIHPKVNIDGYIYTLKITAGLFQ